MPIVIYEFVARSDLNSKATKSIFYMVVTSSLFFFNEITFQLKKSRDLKLKFSSRLDGRSHLVWGIVGEDELSNGCQTNVIRLCCFSFHYHILSYVLTRMLSAVES